MSKIDLPINRPVRFGGPVVVICCACLVLCCPLAWPWRLLLAVSVTLHGAWLWQRFLYRRPLRLYFDRTDCLRCDLADGRQITVTQMHCGIIRPFLVSARLRDEAGEQLDLFVPGPQLSIEAHWRLRRGLIAWRRHVEGGEASPS
jgi:hypothetical protein